MEIKYTNDGKKVVIIGNLNSQEKIVQEIFVVNGNEVASGENFVVKSLHDAPSVSWKDEELNRLEARYVKRKKDFEWETERLETAYNKSKVLLEKKIEYFGKVLKNADEKAFSTLSDYICGNIKYILIEGGYELPTIVTMAEFKETDDRDLRLVSIFGKDDGTFQYAMGRYSDYSGGREKFIPFLTLEAAEEKLKEMFLARERITFDLIDACKKYSVELPKEKVDEFYLYVKNDRLRQIESAEMTLEKAKKLLAELPL